MDSKKPKTIPDAIKNFTEVIDPKAKSSFKLGRKNQARLERIRQISAQMKGARR